MSDSAETAAVKAELHAARQLMVKLTTALKSAEEDVSFWQERALEARDDARAARRAEGYIAARAAGWEAECKQLREQMREAVDDVRELRAMLER